MKRISYSTLTALLVAVLLVAGCGKDESKNKDLNEGVNKVSPNNPIKISVFQHSARLTDEEYNEFFVEPVKEKYPYISLELVRSDKESTPDSLVATGALPDIIYTGVAGMKPFLNLKALEDLNPLVLKNNLDLAKFDSTFMQLSRQFGANGELK